MREAEDIFLSKFGITAANLEFNQCMQRLVKELATGFKNSVLSSAAPQPNFGMVCNVQQALQISKKALSTIVFGQGLPPLNLLYPR